MNKLESMCQYLQPFRVEWLENRIGVLKKYLPKLYQSNLIDYVDSLLEEEFCKQEENVQRKATYLCVFYLHSSILTESFEYQICITDEKLYLDDNSGCRYWYPDFIYTTAKDDRALIKKALMKKFVRLSNHEIEYHVNKIREDYVNLVEVYFSQIIGEITRLEKFQNIRKDDQFNFLFGEYMGEVRIFKA